MEILKYLINVNQPSSNNLCILFTLWRPQTVALQRWQKSYNWLTFDKLGNCRPVEHLCQCYAHPAKGPTFWSKSLSAVPSSSALYHKKFRNCRSDPQNTGVTEIPFTGQVPSFLLRTCCTSTKTSNGCPQGNQLHQLCKVCFQSDIICFCRLDPCLPYKLAISKQVPLSSLIQALLNGLKLLGVLEETSVPKWSKIFVIFCNPSCRGFPCVPTPHPLSRSETRFWSCVMAVCKSCTAGVWLSWVTWRDHKSLRLGKSCPSRVKVELSEANASFLRYKAYQKKWQNQFLSIDHSDLDLTNSGQESRHHLHLRLQLGKGWMAATPQAASQSPGNGVPMALR